MMSALDVYRIHKDAIVVDCHTDVVQQLFGQLDGFGQRQGSRRLGERSTWGQLDIPRMIEGGIDCEVFAVWTDPRRYSNTTLRALELLETLLSEIELNHERIGLAKSYSEIVSLIGKQKIAALLSLEGGEPLSGKIDILDTFYRLGIRLLGLTWSFQNELGSGVREKQENGLTDFGLEVVKRCNNVGIVVDVSHLNRKGFYDVANIAEKPFIASHSNAASLYNHRRNLDDRQIKIIADRGGVIGINFNPSFLAENDAGINEICKHIIHVTTLVGSQYVGLGSDFDGMHGVPVLMEDASKLPLLTQKLIDQGLSRNDIENILGQSMLRVFREVL